MASRPLARARLRYCEQSDGLIANRPVKRELLEFNTVLRGSEYETL